MENSMNADSPALFSHKRKYLYALTGWSMLVAGSLAWNINQENQETLGAAVASARANINKDISFRKWVASHGGVYVAPTAHTPPNPYLHVPDRDVVTTTGKKLTLLNPAYALREMQSNYSNGTKSHIISLKPLNPVNAADAWEANALASFEHGTQEVIEMQQIDGQSYMRLIRPFMVERDCLKCHAQQGYKIGDIRGGISTAVSMSTYLVDEQHRNYALGYTHGLIWLIGLLTLYISSRHEQVSDEERRLVQAALLENESSFRNMFESNAAVMLLIDQQSGAICEANAAAARFYGYSIEDLRALNINQINMLTPEEVATELARIVKLERNYFIFPHRLASGEVRTVEARATPIKVGSKFLVFSIISDITERIQAEKALLESENQLRLLLDSAAEAIYGMDIDGKCTFCNPSCLKMLGYHHQDELHGQNMHELIHHKHRDGTAYAEAECPVHRAILQAEASHVDDEVFWRADGTSFPAEYWSYPQIIDGKVVGAVVTFLDITARKESDDKLWNQANFDPLTGLPNRRMFHDRLEQELKKTQRTQLPLALMLIDLDHFKEINDTLGHDMGDILLVESARRIMECVRQSDTVARLGGDEFIVILPELDDISNAERIATSIVQRLASPFSLHNETSYVSASIGITFYPDDASTIEELFKNADQAMYVAKSLGRNRYNYFTSAMQQSAQNKLRLVNDLRNALAAGQFVVYFQPIVELAGGWVNKAEALIRWQHPERGLVRPADFIALAEETGLIFEIGDWVFHEAMLHAKYWRAHYNPLLQISVNKSPVQFYKDGDAHSAWLSWLHEHDLPGQCLAIEITEGLLLDSNASISNALITLRNANIQVSIDDFGTGYSSLSYLKKFDIDYLKIDQSFIRDLQTDPNDLALSEAIIVMAHKLGMKVVAEGVETREQRDLLTQAGCDYGQGFLFAKPMPQAQFESFCISTANAFQPVAPQA